MKKPRVGLIGCGNIGKQAAQFIAEKLAKKMSLRYLYDSYPEKAVGLAQTMRGCSKCSFEQLVQNSDIILEAASKEAVSQLFAKPRNLRDKTVILLSVGGVFEQRNTIFRAAEKQGIHLLIPSGALCGIDGVRAASFGKIRSCTLFTQKPPRGFEGNRYVAERKVNLQALHAPRTLFKGNVHDAVKLFPQNINIAATVALALRTDKLEVLIQANPFIQKNIHQLRVDSDIGNISVTVENVPSKDNPKTSALTVASLKALLSSLASGERIGT